MEEAAAGRSKKPRLSTGGGLAALTLRLASKFFAARKGSDGHYENIVFSPLTIHAALALVAAGARGTTLDEILLLLGAPSRDELAEFARTLADRVLAERSSDDGGSPDVRFAGGVWHDKTVVLKPEYRTAAVESNKAVTCAADFIQEVSS